MPVIIEHTSNNTIELPNFNGSFDGSGAAWTGATMSIHLELGTYDSGGALRILPEQTISV